MFLSRCLSSFTSMRNSRGWFVKFRLRRAVLALAAISPALLVGACGSSSSSSSGGSSTSLAAAATAPTKPQTIVWAVQGGVNGGVGSEGLASRDVIANFEKVHPNIKVQVLALSSDADTAIQTVNQAFIAGDSTPDIIDSDPTWVAPFANAGFIVPLQQSGISPTSFLPGEVSQGTYNGKLYGVFWYDGAEGLYYRTDLVKTPPKTPMQLVTDAQAAMKADPKLKEGIAFEGMKYEGAVTVFNDLMASFGGKFDPSNLDTPQNVAALQFLHDLIYKYKVASTSVTSWDEGGADKAFQAGQAAFETNWPFVLQEVNTKGSPLYNKVGFEPFPTLSGVGTATQGGDELVINAKTKHLGRGHDLPEVHLVPQPAATAGGGVGRSTGGGQCIHIGTVQQGALLPNGPHRVQGEQPPPGSRPLQGGLDLHPGHDLVRARQSGEPGGRLEVDGGKGQVPGRGVSPPFRSKTDKSAMSVGHSVDR